jgi:inner membrane protein
VDPLTHGLLGATIGQGLFGRRLGARAMAAGAVAAMLPDVDFVVRAAGALGEWRYHRGPTHSLWLTVLVGLLLGFACARWERGSVRAWSLLFVLALVSHPLLDWCTTYGTQLLAPFSRRRFALDAVAIVDPLYSLVLAAALVAAAVWGVRSRAAATAGVLALLLTTGYLAYGLELNRRAEAMAGAQLAAAGVADARVQAYPTLLQLYQRRVVARRGDDVFVGWLSLWRPHPIEWQRFRVARDPLVDAARATEEGRTFEWFAMGQTAAGLHRSATGETVVEIDDLRYGFPSTPEWGIWGIRVRFDEEGRMDGPPAPIHRPLPAPVRALVAQIFRETFGRH